MTITEFLLARLAEDEARTVSYKLKRGAPGMSIGDPRIPEGHVSIGETIRGLITMPRAEYYATHCDPVTDDRKMAEVAAKRAIIELHESWPVLAETPPTFENVDSDIDSVAYRASQKIAWLTTQEYRARFGEEPPTAPVLRALASVYADHPDYDPKWAL